MSHSEFRTRIAHRLFLRHQCYVVIHWEIRWIIRVTCVTAWPPEWKCVCVAMTLLVRIVEPRTIKDYDRWAVVVIRWNDWLPPRRWNRVEINSAQKDTARSSHTNCGMQTHTHSFFLIHTTRRTEIFSQNFVCLVSVRSSLVSVCYLDIGLYNSCRTGTATARIPNHMPQQQQDTLGAHVMRMDGCEKLVWGNGGNAPISASSRRAIESPLTLPLWT